MVLRRAWTAARKHVLSTVDVQCAGSIDDAVENDRLVDLDHFPDLVVELARMLAANTVGVIGLRQLDEIRQRFGTFKFRT